MEFLLNSGMGRLSDAHGRRPFLLIGPTANMVMKMAVFLNPTANTIMMERILTGTFWLRSVAFGFSLFWFFHCYSQPVFLLLFHPFF